MRTITCELTLAEVRRLLGFMPEEALAELAEGPLPDLGPHDMGYTEARDCRACVVLERFPASGPAKALLNWHDLTDATFEIMEALEEGLLSVERPPIDRDKRVVRQAAALTGALSYARCCVIYSTAQALIAGRAGHG